MKPTLRDDLIILEFKKYFPKYGKLDGWEIVNIDHTFGIFNLDRNLDTVEGLQLCTINIGTFTFKSRFQTTNEYVYIKDNYYLMKWIRIARKIIKRKLFSLFLSPSVKALVFLLENKWGVAIASTVVNNPIASHLKDLLNSYNSPTF